MKFEEKTFYVAWPDYVDLKVSIRWTAPAMHDVLFSNHVAEDDEAYFYAITARCRGAWYAYYIGMVYDQSASLRHRQGDHVERLAELKRRHPDLNFGISLGVPDFNGVCFDRRMIEEIEGLLIYSNWHEDMINIRKVDFFCSPRQIHVKNTGFSDHLEKEVFYGVTYRSD